MKKILKKIGVVILVIIFFTVACSSDDSVEEKHEEEEVVEEVKETIEEEVDIEEKEEVDERAILEIEEEKDYVSYQMGITKTIGESFTEISQLIANPEDTDEWSMKVVARIITIESTAEDFLNYGTPPAKYTEVHNLVGEAMKEYIKAMQILPEALDNGDSVAINRATDYINTGGTYIKEATEKLDVLVEEQKAK